MHLPGFLRTPAVASDGIVSAEHLSHATHRDVLMPHPHVRVSCTLAGTERVLRKRVASVTYVEASEGSTDSESEGAKAIAPQRGSGGGGGGGGGVTGDAGDGAAGGAAPTDSTGDTGRGGQRRQRRRARARVDASAAQRGRGPVACGAVARARRRRTAQPATRCRSAPRPGRVRTGWAGSSDEARAPPDAPGAVVHRSAGYSGGACHARLYMYV